ncbi:flagellin N-methylase [Burkholderia stabilis]|uniref:YkgJ family cysteine cluster protein n=1 Tax=Burkholderia stabilis TaxID=95485 RepID=UPI000851EF47|nr:YkgJ family cysteine cluster protein [Burkholderia stabilis]AOR71760.1 flagellin N-methylase [Burkholderia stabilis]HDR9492806.1 YkgJ family cysteine cluster protein [Burkholderia stabilis]HDR9525033.1 YkgJ family cysteine cluster protein [Burkholderia stabilis]HDR9533291.1 YkgJ family cysteine cluster protein [Burkholderia stabilis]HDR9540117.1 YkgJ family cysteine cluster protein [Burkholderia stabilis]
MVDTYLLACNACGRCCNSAPALSLRELFRHRRRFVGALTIRRVPKHRVGERWRAGGREHALDADDVAAADALAARLFHRIGGPGNSGGEWVALTLQGYDYPSLGRCAALADDGRCSVHADKPSICGAVPLDPLLPDRLQTRVLAARRDDATWLGANCIVEAGDEMRSPASVFPIPLVTAGHVADRIALDTHRDALVFERAVWRDAVFASLAESGQGLRDAVSRLAPGGYLTVSIVPVLLAVAQVSAHCRALCIGFIDDQLALIGASVDAALARRHADDRPATRELRGFAQALERARHALAAMPAPAADAPRIDAWLDDRPDTGTLAA